MDSIDNVRHYGEAVAAVVADSQDEANAAVEAIKVEYKALDLISSPGQALKDGAILIHEEMKSYSHIDAIRQEPGTNVANRNNRCTGYEEIEKAVKRAQNHINVL